MSKQEVSRAHPCPACGKPDWCCWFTDNDGERLRCMRGSETPLGMKLIATDREGGSVFVHDDDVDVAPERKPPAKRSVSSTGIDAEALSRRVRSALTEDHLHRLAEATGLEADLWDRLGVGWTNESGGAWCLPERDAAGRVIGVQYRSPDGQKGFAKGTHRGLTIPEDFAAHAELCGDDPVLIVEGASDVVAARAMGFAAVGRPSNTGGVGLLATFLEGRNVLVMGERDQKPDGSWPGRDGAERVANGLAGAWGVPVPVIFPPEGVKDLRELMAVHHGDGSDARDALREVISDCEDDESSQGAPAMDEYTSFPVELLPQPVRAFVEENARSIGVDPSYLALPLLTACAGAIGNSAVIRPKQDWEEPCILWTAIVGESGTGKSPALNRVLKIVNDRENKQIREHLLAVKQAEPAADVEPCPRFLLNDVTTEMLIKMLHENPRGLLVACDELSGWFDHDRYASGRGGGGTARWLQVWGGGSISLDRKHAGSDHAERASVSICGGIQPGILKRVLTQTHQDNGLAARVLFAMPPERPMAWSEDTMSKATSDAMRLVFDRLFEMPMESLSDGELVPRVFAPTSDAKPIFVRFYDRIGEDVVGMEGAVRAAWNKLKGQAARLALVHHLIRVADEDPTLGDPDRVDEVSVRAGIGLALWFGGEAKRVYARLGVDE
ncbi:MAG: DUF3987 domain-containing protein, partial [Planctomycetota bacterium]